MSLITIKTDFWNDEQKQKSYIKTNITLIATTALLLFLKMNTINYILIAFISGYNYLALLSINKKYKEQNKQ